MNLIISLLGQNHGKLFSEKFIYNNKLKKDYFLLDELINKFNFCKKIYIIVDKTKITTKNIFFTKRNSNKKIKVIYSKQTNNQIQSILKVEKYIQENESIILLNPDSNFKIDHRDFNYDNDGLIFCIDSPSIGRNIGKKDILITNSKNHIVKIKKKMSFPFIQKVSAGIYCLKKWKYFVEYANKIKSLKSTNLQAADVFSKIIKNKIIKTKEVKKFTCFENLKKIEEYKFWKNYFLINYKSIDKLKKIDIQNIIPSAGEGSRHKHLGYKVPKPLIPVSSKKMFERSLESLPNSKNNLFIFRKPTFKKFELQNNFFKNKNKSKFHLITKKTKGMAITIAKARKLIQVDKPVIVSSCDIKCVIDYSKFYQIIKRENPTAMIFTWSQYPFASESPNSHAYVKDDKLVVTKISEKKPVSLNPDNDNAVTGIFYFSRGKDLLDCIDYSIKNKITVNGEYYVATAMTKLLNENKKIINFKVKQLISWSLPEHLSDYLFWEKIFVNESD